MTSTIQLLQSHPFLLGLALRLSLLFLLPLLLDDNPLLRGVRYTDIDYDVFTDAAFHVADGRSPYERHTYRYTPFLASLLIGTLLSAKYFGKILFCVADAICGYIIVVLRKQRRRRISEEDDDERQYKQNNNNNVSGWRRLLDISPGLKDSLWWLYNPLPINICTRGSAESLVVLLPVLATSSWRLRRWGTTIPIIARACLAGIMHGVGIHAKLYPVIYTISFMAYFSHWNNNNNNNNEYKLLLTMLPNELQTYQRRDGLILFLVFTVGTVGALTHAAVHFHGREALEEGLLYHFQRVDHRHNYSMYWYWIYLARGRSYANANELSAVASPSSSIWGHLPLIPQVLILGFSSLGIAPYDLTFALFCQTFAFVAFNKVMTAQYFTWYLCLLPLCSDRIKWNSRRMAFSLGLLAISIIAWLLSAFSLEMLGWRSHRQVWLASLFFFVANVNLLTSILDGYKHEQIARAKTRPGEGWSKPKAKVT
ncbi:predicted protein [Thalassiosira pseudonana CCMP1335]|uniref:GPI mannosyltransferase 1 n=1 Tax=Thalassiosira pseudonana TaxID=35128 RepID=B8CDX6_THAPS|nr:predicted protein [Thalassiosira pseudonana CCMP1335]EED88173.1 predicted protein [Thalassiosira pseudonana CCMP1335]